MKNNNNGHIFKAIGAALIIVVLVALAIRHFFGKKVTDPVPSTDTLVEESAETTETGELYEEEEGEAEVEVIVTPPGNGFEKSDAAKFMDSKDSVQMEKLITQIIDDGEGNQEVSYSSYYTAELDFKALSCITSDYTDCMVGGGYVPENVKDISFVDAFGFSYQGCENMSEFFELARKSSGFDADLTDASYDEEKYKLMKEESYEFNGDSSILYQMLGNMDFDKLLRSESFYTLHVSEDGVKYPSMMTAIVQYEKDGKVVTKTAYLGFLFYNEGDLAGCDCGQDSGCGGSDCGSSSSCGCSDSEEEGSCGCNGTDPCPSCGGVGGCLEGCSGDCCK